VQPAGRANRLHRQVRHIEMVVGAMRDHHVPLGALCEQNQHGGRPLRVKDGVGSDPFPAHVIHQGVAEHVVANTAGEPDRGAQPGCPDCEIGSRATGGRDHFAGRIGIGGELVGDACDDVEDQVPEREQWEHPAASNSLIDRHGRGAPLPCRSVLCLTRAAEQLHLLL
jgi:hypothetical protein